MIYSSTNTFVSRLPPLCMQCGRYSFCGIHAAALLKHTVIGWRLHHADYYCAYSVIHCSAKIHLLLSIFSRKSHRDRKCRPGMIRIPGNLLNIREYHQNGTDIHYPFSHKGFCLSQIRALPLRNAPVPCSPSPACRNGRASSAYCQATALQGLRPCASLCHSTDGPLRCIHPQADAHAAPAPCSLPSSRLPYMKEPTFVCFLLYSLFLWF